MSVAPLFPEKPEKMVVPMGVSWKQKTGILIAHFRNSWYMVSLFLFCIHRPAQIISFLPVSWKYPLSIRGTTNEIAVKYLEIL